MSAESEKMAEDIDNQIQKQLEGLSHQQYLDVLEDLQSRIELAIDAAEEDEQ